MKKRLKLCIVFTSLLAACLLLPSLITWSCGPILYADESRFALFRNGLDGRSSLTPFSYSESLFTVTDADPQKLDYRQNCQEWLKYTGDEIKEEDVYAIQYATSPDSFLHSFKYNNWTKFGNNSFIRWLRKNENKHALHYMVLAKQAESTQFDTRDPWDTTIASNGIELDTLAARADRAIQPALPQFLKERYAFQSMKMYYYAGRQDRNFNPRLMKLYDEYLDGKKSIVSGWGNIYYALAQNDQVKRTLYLLRAFDNSEEKKKFTYHYIEKDGLAALERVTTDPKTLALISTIKALKNKGRAIDEIRSAAKYYPSSPYLPLLISREVNKLENWIWSPEILAFYENLRAEEDAFDASKPKELIHAQNKDRKYLQSFTTYLDSIITVVPGHTTFRQLALAHLYNIGQQFDKASQLLQQVQPHNNNLYETQWQIENIITLANLHDVTTPETQQEIALSIQKLIQLNPVFLQQLNRDKYNNWEHEGDNEQNDDLSELYMLLSRCFRKKGDLVTAGLLYTKANVTANYYDGWEDSTSANYKSIAYFDRYASPEHIDKILQFKHLTSKTPFQQLVSPFRWASDDMYKDLKGTLFFRQKKYNEALAVFSSMHKNFWQKNYDYHLHLPLTSVMHTGKMVPSERSVAPRYSLVSKKLVVQDMVTLLNSIKTTSSNQAKAKLYYHLANAYFNTSYYGKAWMMMSYGKSTNELDNWDMGNYRWSVYKFYPHQKTYKADYYQCRAAIDTYKKALALTTDKELAAKCLLSLSYCDRVAYNINPGNNNEQRRYTSPYLRQFVQSYSNTTTYRYAKIECPDVRSYLKR